MRHGVVSDSGPLITAERLNDGFRTIRKIFDRILIPAAVHDELSFPFRRFGSDFIHTHGLADLVDVVDVPVTIPMDADLVLERGEIEALSLAVSESCYLLIEDGLARIQAERFAKAGKIPGFAGLAGAVREGFRSGALTKDEALTTVDRIRMVGRLDPVSWKSVRGQIEHIAAQ